MDRVTGSYPAEHFRKAVAQLMSRAVEQARKPPREESINDAIVRAGGVRPRS